MPETIDLLLKELKLPAFFRHYQCHQEQAMEHGYGHIRYLSGLCEQGSGGSLLKTRATLDTRSGLACCKKLYQPESGRTQRVCPTTGDCIKRSG